MKKYFITILSLVAIFFLYQYFVYEKGFYLNFNGDAEITTNFVTKKNQLLQIVNGKEVPFVVKAVDVTSALPGHFASDYAVDKETYLAWFQSIQKMGANTLQVSNILDDNFYDALYEYNSKHTNQLYLLQGLQVSDYANNASSDAFDQKFYGTLKSDAQTIVDVIHGKKNIILDRGHGFGIYRRDVSPWLIGYVVGHHWNSGTMAYTNHKQEARAAFDGTYVYTTKDATSFEAMLADVLDGLLHYESNKYGQQHLVSISNDPSNDPFSYNEDYSLQMSKYTTLDAEHIKMKRNVKSGYFASYRLFETSKEITKYFSTEEKARLGSILTNVNTNAYNGGYIEILNKYHTMPLFISGYGISSARGIDSFAVGIKRALSEKEQGEHLVRIYKEIMQAGSVGACITAWQDAWGARSWNTSYSVDVNNAMMWSDIQTSNQGYGLLSFDQGLIRSKYKLDGKSDEWAEETNILRGSDGDLYAAYDERYVYIMIKKVGLKERDSLYIPFDVTPKSGSDTSKVPSLSFQRKADFLLQIHGRQDSRLLVQERYEALRENYLRETKAQDPFIKIPTLDSSVFVPIGMIVKSPDIIDNYNALPPQARLASVFDTGKLTHGNGDPSNPLYNSLADFCYGKDTVEIRIPWQLLNFSDPSQNKIHDDYYLNYGVKDITIDQLYMGLGSNMNKTKIEMKELALHGWDEIEYHERLKQSYSIIQKAWMGDDDIAN